MFRNYSLVGKVLYAIALGIGIVALITLAYTWSLSQTQLLFSAIMPSAALAFTAALFIQLLPQAAFTTANSARVKAMLGIMVLMIIVGVAANAIDALTNVAAFDETWNPEVFAARSPLFTELAYWIGMVVAVGITFAEELVLIFFAAWLELVAEIAEELGFNVPFFRSGNYQGLTQASRYAANPNASKRNHSGGQGGPGQQSKKKKKPQQPQTRAQQYADIIGQQNHYSGRK